MWKGHREATHLSRDLSLSSVVSRTKQQLLGTGDQLSGTGYGKPGTVELGGTGLGVWRVAGYGRKIAGMTGLEGSLACIGSLTCGVDWGQDKSGQG